MWVERHKERVVLARELCEAFLIYNFVCVLENVENKLHEILEIMSKTFIIEIITFLDFLDF